MSLIETVNYDTPGNFIFSDPNEIEIVGGLARLKDQRPTDATFHINYNSNINGNWGNGVLTGTATGGATVVGGKLDLTGSTLKFVVYDANLNADSQQVGTIRFSLTPNYSGPPSSDQAFFQVKKGVGELVNLWGISHLSGTGNLKLFGYNSVGVLIISVVVIAGWAPVAGVEVEMELNYDITAGITDFFLNGIKQGSTITNTYTRDSNINSLALGTDVTHTLTANFKIDDIVIFSKKQHTANYTPGESISETIFSKNNPSLFKISGFEMDALEKFVETTSDTTGNVNDEIKYTLNVNGQDKYHDGTAWVDSDSTYAQANTPEEIELNKVAFISTGITFKLRAFLHSDNGFTGPTLSVVTIDFNFFETITAPTTCIIFGNYRDISGNGVGGATVKFSLFRKTSEYKEAANSIIEASVEVTTLSSGYFEISLIRSSQYEGSGVYSLTISKTDGKLLTQKDSTATDLTFTVPDLISKNIADLLIAS